MEIEGEDAVIDNDVGSVMWLTIGERERKERREREREREREVI